jgi:hypothetical protein
MPPHQIKITPPPVNSRWHRAIINYSCSQDFNYSLAAGEAVTQIKKMGIYLTTCIAYRQIYHDKVKNELILELIDVLTEMEEEQYADTQVWVCEVTLTCKLCKSQYTGWQKLNRRMFDPGPYRLELNHCPACPPISIPEWLGGTVRLLQTKPVSLPPDQKRWDNPPLKIARITLTPDELDDMPD